MTDKEEKELRDIIQEAWNEGNSNPEDRFGDFLRRAASAIKGADFVKLAKDQTLPEFTTTARHDDAPWLARNRERTQQEMVTPKNGTAWRKVELGE